MVSPTKLAHVVFQTNDVPLLSAWWCNVLEARVQYGTEDIAFLAFDDEHHRIAMVKHGSYTPRDDRALGTHHVAFTYTNLAELIETYLRLLAQNIAPVRTIRHGPTFSLYYRDPDGNQFECQVDAYDTVDEANEFMHGPLFAANPIGIEFDMNEVVRQFADGVPEKQLLLRPDVLANG